MGFDTAVEMGGIRKIWVTDSDTCDTVQWESTVKSPYNNTCHVYSNKNEFVVTRGVKLTVSILIDEQIKTRNGLQILAKVNIVKWETANSKV